MLLLIALRGVKCVPVYGLSPVRRFVVGAGGLGVMVGSVTAVKLMVLRSFGFLAVVLVTLQIEVAWAAGWLLGLASDVIGAVGFMSTYS